MQRFIDYFLVIGIDEEKQKRAVIDGKILCKLPEQDWEESQFIDENLALFCQPLGWNLTEKPVEPTFFISVLTDIKANRHYCACLSFSEPISTKSIRNCDDEETEYGQIFYQNQNTMFAPKCLVLVSRFHYIEILKNCLSIIFTVYTEEKNVSLETIIGNLLACVEVPAPGEPELEFSLGASDLQYLQSPVDPLVPNTGNIVYQLFEQLGIHTVLTLFIAVMTEHKVLIHSQSFSRLHDACEALISLMYPFKYSHVYIPLLPCSLTEVLNIPTPFLIGCHSKLKSEFEETLIETIIVDLDCGRLSLPDVKLPALDKITYNELVNQLCLIIKPQSVYADNAFQAVKFNNSSPPHLLDKEIRAVFLRFIAQVLQGYRNFLQVVRIFPKPFLTFHKTLFLGTRNLVENEFTIKLLDSMFFNTFIQERGLPYRCVDLFDNLFASINDILKEEEKNPNLFFKNIRNLAEKLLLNEFTCNKNNPVVKILKPSKEAIEKTCSKTFPKLDTKNILEKIENETIKKEMTQSLVEKKAAEKKIVPFGAKLSSISCTYSSNIMTNSAKRLEVMKNCINCIFENKITDARKTFPAVLRALKNKFARLALAEELSLYITNNKAVLEHEQFDLVVKLMNCALQQDCDYLSENTSGLCTSELGDVNGLSAAILPLSMTFCRRLNTGVIQFAYCCLQNHSVWSKMSFWESAFYSDAEKDLLALYGLDKNLSKDENYHQLVLNVAAEQMKLAETLTEEEVAERSNKEESTVYSQAIHYSYRMVYLKIPLDICNIEKNSRSKHLNSITDGHSDSNSNLTDTVTGRDSIFEREGRDLDNESGYEEVPTSKYSFCTNSEKSMNVIKYIDRFVDKVALEAGISEDHIKSLHNLIPSIVDLQCETLDGVFKESKKLPPPLKSKLITPYLLPGEKLVTNGLRAFLIEECRDETIDFNNSENVNTDNYGDSMVNSIHLPAEGGIFLTNYRIIFRGKSYDPLSSETCIVKYFPISTLFKEKRVSFPSHTFASFDQYLHEGLQLRSNIFQIINLAFDEEVNSDEIDHFCKAINKTTNPSSIFLWFAFTSQSPSYNQIDLLSLQNKKNKRGTFKGFAKKTLLKTAEKTGLNVHRNKKRKEKYFMAPLSGSKTMLHSKTPIIMENILDERSLNDDISIKSDSSHLFNNASNNSPNDPILKIPPIHKEKDYRTLRKLVELPYVRDYQRLQIGNAKNLLNSQTNSNNNSVISPSKQHSKDFRISIVNLNYNVSQTYPAFIVVPAVIKDESIKKLSKCYKSQRFPAIIWKHPKNKTLLIRASSFHGKGVLGLFKSHGPSSNITTNISNMSSSSQNDSTAFEQEKFFKTIVSLIPKKSENNTSYSASVNSLDFSMISDLNLSNKELKNNKNLGMSSISRAFNTLRTSGGKSGLGTISQTMGKQIQKWNNKFNQDPDTNSLSSTVTSLSQNSNLVKTNYAINGGESISSSTLGIVSLGLPKSISFYIFGEKIQIKNLKVDQFPSSCGFVPVEIHETKNVKHSFEKLLKVCCPSSKSKSKFKHGFYHEIENTDWLKQLQTILTISNDIVNTLNYKGCSAMLCLEESSDLVPQIISIAELCLDPYYRTFHGFKVLIEKEWLAFGHRFSHRSNQVTPIFLQFLDLVHQIMNQFPLSFEFNQYYLKFIAYHYMSCRFRTFMLDSEAERAEFGWIYEDIKKFDDDCDFISGKDFVNPKLQDQDNLNNQPKNLPFYSNTGINYIGTSFWDYAENIWNKKSIFFNFYYVAASYLGESSDEKNLCVLKPKISLNNFRVWDYFLNEELNHGPSYDFEMIAFEKQRREEQEATEADNKVSHGNKRSVISPSMESVSHFQPNGIEEMLSTISILENELNINEKNWYQMWDKIEIPMLSLTRLNSRNSNRKSIISYQILRRYNVSSNSINNFLLSNQKLHKFEKLNFASLIVCDYCKTIILDLARTGYKCKDCNLNCHERCYDYVSRTKCLGKELRSYINHSMDQEEENSENAEENKIDENTLHRSDTYFKEFSNTNSLAENQTHAGSLCKKGVLLKNWKRSWFVLDSNKHQLRYYESKENPSNKGFIDLADVVSVGVLSGAENNIFELKTIRRNYNFMAPDKHSAAEWVEKIQACLQ